MKAQDRKKQRDQRLIDAIYDRLEVIEPKLHNLDGANMTHLPVYKKLDTEHGELCAELRKLERN